MTQNIVSILCERLGLKHIDDDNYDEAEYFDEDETPIYTCLMWAIKLNNIIVSKKIIEDNPTLIDIPNICNHTPLFYALGLLNRDEIVANLIKQGANINYGREELGELNWRRFINGLASSYGNICYFLCSIGESGVISILLNEKFVSPSDFFLKNSDNISPYMVASKNNHRCVTKILDKINSPI